MRTLLRLALCASALFACAPIDDDLEEQAEVDLEERAEELRISPNPPSIKRSELPIGTVCKPNPSLPDQEDCTYAGHVWYCSISKNWCGEV